MRGDVEALYNASGVLQVRYIYDSWGNTISVQNASRTEITSATNIGNLNPIRYRGYYWDADIGLYYLQSRYYDPVTCRFINADSRLNTNSLLGYNLFAYCENNPVNKVDLTGHMAKEATIAATNWWNPVGWVAAAILAVEVVVVVAVVCVSVDKLATVVKDTVETADKILNTRDQSVYIMRDKNTNAVQYVGRTNNPERRQAEHDRDSKKDNLQPLEVKFTGLTKSEARAMEQLLISSYTLKNLDNARREIATGKVSAFAGSIGNIISIFGSALEDEFINLMER